MKKRHAKKNERFRKVLLLIRKHLLKQYEYSIIIISWCLIFLQTENHYFVETEESFYVFPLNS